MKRRLFFSVYKWGSLGEEGYFHLFLGNLSSNAARLMVIIRVQTCMKMKVSVKFSILRCW